ncbi:MAG: esterase/lipase superfamily enzyme [Myxococcota bacterium]|jgi:esterase/lipase superfamily enzyme
MRVACWGHFGVPVLLFPTGAADYLDHERFLMLHKLEPLIEAGRIKVYTCDGITAEGWLNANAHPAHKSWMQACFDRYLVAELLPHIKDDCGGTTGIIASGASIGAYNAVTAACRHPEWFSRVIGMSGTYAFDRWMSGFTDANYYFSQPLYFVPRLQGPDLDALRQVHFVLAAGQGRAEAPEESRRMAEVLSARGVSVDLQIWGPDVHHDWPTWRTWLPLFLDSAT